MVCAGSLWMSMQQLHATTNLTYVVPKLIWVVLFRNFFQMVCEAELAVLCSWSSLVKSVSLLTSCLWQRYGGGEPMVHQAALHMQVLSYNVCSHPLAMLPCLLTTSYALEQDLIAPLSMPY
jgi:hypothetical protein